MYNFNHTIEHSYQIINLSNLNSLRQNYNELVKDPYCDEMRYRRIAYFSYDQSSETFSLLPNHSYWQNKDYNTHLGGVHRHFSAINPNFCNSAYFRNILKTFVNSICLSKNLKLSVHMIRVSTKSGKESVTAPEGIHQDGYKRVAILVVDRNNIQGGITNLYKNKNSSPIFSKKLAIGEMVVINDERLFHSVSNIKAKTANSNGYRDILILTAQ